MLQSIKPGNITVATLKLLHHCHVLKHRLTALPKVVYILSMKKVIYFFDLKLLLFDFISLALYNQPSLQKYPCMAFECVHA